MLRAALALLLLLVLAAPAQAGWAPVGSMSEPRTWHSAVLLDDGRVLVAGGHTPSGVTNSAEIYDPATGMWSRTGAMTSPRGLFMMIKLAGGEVLAAGGVVNGAQNAWTATAEVYNPATGTWRGVQSLNSARQSAAIGLLPDGRPFVAGGGSAYVVTNAVEIFNANGTWSPGASIPTARAWSVPVTLADGTVLVLGGVDGQVAGLAAAEGFNGFNWSSGALKQARWTFSASRLADGRALAVGGGGSSGSLTSAELYSGGAWTLAPAPLYAHYGAMQTTLPSGRVLVMGSFDTVNHRPYTELYDPVTNRWTDSGSMRSSRFLGTATQLRDGRVLVVGGVDGAGANGTADLYTAPTTLAVGTQLGFADQTAGTAAAAPLQVTNTGDATLFLDGFALGGAQPGEFAVNGDRCRGGIAPGATCVVDVSFTPAVGGARNAVLTFTANAEPGTYAVALSGRGLAGDRDGDGVLDGADRCATLRGPASRSGCPVGLLADPSIAYKRSGKGIRVIAYYVKATTGARVSVKCSKGCKRTVTKGRGPRRVRITRLNGKRLAHGTKITITVTKPGRLTTTVTDRITRGRRIEGRPRCTPVGC